MARKRVKGRKGSDFRDQLSGDYIVSLFFVLIDKINASHLTNLR